MENVNIWQGLLITFIVLSVYKFGRFWFRELNTDFDENYWLRQNWGDYIIHLFITAVFFFFEHDLLEILNPLLIKWGVTWQIPHPENKGFLFVMIPIFTSVVLYPFLRKHFSKPQKK